MRACFFLLVVAAVGACPLPPAPDAGPGLDGGRPGARGADAGPPPADAGGGGADAGPAGADAGPTGPDAGEGDAGSTLDAGSSPHAPPTAAAEAYFSDLDHQLSGAALVGALHDKLAADHVELDYDALLTAYETTDTGRGGCAGIFDFYSTHCWQPAEACGNYSGEGDCFNREHSWPKSWWGGSEGAPQHQDLISVIPADGFVNNVRGNLPLGPVESPDYTSTNGSRRGSCVAEGAPAQCFEPPDDLKGDLARIYFYVAVRYEGELDCCDEPAITEADIDPWLEAVLRAWHLEDPVDLAERERNERVFPFQENRNPFVDYPGLVDQVDDF